MCYPHHHHHQNQHIIISIIITSASDAGLLWIMSTKSELGQSFLLAGRHLKFCLRTFSAASRTFGHSVRYMLKVKGYSLLQLWMGNPSQSYGASLAIWDHTVLPATWHKWTRPTITPANQAATRFTYPGRMEGWVDLGHLIAAWPGIEPTTAWSQVWRPNRYTTESPNVIVI